MCYSQTLFYVLMLVYLLVAYIGVLLGDGVRHMHLSLFGLRMLVHNLRLLSRRVAMHMRLLWCFSDDPTPNWISICLSLDFTTNSLAWPVGRVR